MSYNGSDMVAAAERHYRDGVKALEECGKTTDPIKLSIGVQEVQSHFQAGLLAIELAKWAVMPDGVE